MSVAARLLKLWVRIPPEAWTSVVSVVCSLLLLRHQDLEPMPQMHLSLYAYCSTLVPHVILDVPTSAARCLHVHTT